MNKGITISKESLGVVDEKLDDEDGGNSSDEENDNDMTDATADTASERGATQSESADIHAMSMRKKNIAFQKDLQGMEMKLRYLE